MADTRNIPAPVPGNTDLVAWKQSTDSSLQILASVLLDSATTGCLEKTLHGVVTIRYDDATVRTITEAVAKIQGALAASQAVWLPGQKEIQARLPAARNDLSFQSFLKMLGDSTEQRAGTTEPQRGNGSMNARRGEK